MKTMSENETAIDELSKALEITLRNSLREDCWRPADWTFVNSVLKKYSKG